jgi:hypothetical protein
MIVYPLGRFDNSPPPENLSRYVFVWHQKITLLYGKSYAQVSAATYHFIALRGGRCCEVPPVGFEQCDMWRARRL